MTLYLYPSQHFPFGAAFVCQAGNFWTLLRKYSCEMPDIFFANFNLILIFSTDFRENFSIRFLRNPSSGSRFDMYGETARRKEMKKLIIGALAAT